MVVGYQEHQTLPSQLSYLQKHSFSSRGSRNTQPSCLFLMLQKPQGLKKSAVWLSRTSKFSCRASNFHFHLPKGQRPRKDVCPDLPRACKIWELLVPRASWNSSFFEPWTTISSGSIEHLAWHSINWLTIKDYHNDNSCCFQIWVETVS